MTMGNAAVCCRAANGAAGGFTPNGSGAGIILPGAGRGVSRGDRTFLEQIEDALQDAIHGGDGGGSSGGGAGSAADSLFNGSNVIDFPLVDPYKPIRRAGRPPVPGYTAFPAPQNSLQASRNRRLVNVRMVKAKAAAEMAEEEASKGSQALGFIDPFNTGAIPSGYSLGSGTGKLSTVLNAIQNTLPATVAAFRASPQNLSYYPSQAGYNQGGYTEYPGGQQAGANIGAQTGAAVGNIGDTVGNIVRQHPYLVLAGVAGAVLLFMNPPRRR